MKCNYKEIECLYDDMGGSCTACEHYDHGVRATGATPILGWIIEKIRKWRSAFS